MGLVTIVGVIYAYGTANTQYMNIRDTLSPIIMSLIDAGYYYSQETYTTYKLMTLLVPALGLPPQVVSAGLFWLIVLRAYS